MRALNLLFSPKKGALTFLVLVFSFGFGLIGNSQSNNSASLSPMSPQAHDHSGTPKMADEDVMKKKVNDFTSFNGGRNIPIEEKFSREVLEKVKEETPKRYHDHPEFGTIPYNTQCDSCFELIQKRTKDERYFKKIGSENTIYVQKCKGDLHIKNEKGQWITLNPHLRPAENSLNTYSASTQPVPTKFDKSTGYSIIEMENGTEFRFNKEVSFLHMENGKVRSRKSIDLSSTTVGKDGVHTSNAWNSIDREAIHRTSEIKTNYLVNGKLNVADTNGWAVFEDRIQLPGGHAMIKDDTSGKTLQNGIWRGDLLVVGPAGKELLRWEMPAVYDSKRDHAGKVGYKLIEKGSTYIVRTYVKMGFLQDPQRAYPITVDPLVSGSNTYSSGQIGFSEFLDDGSGYCGNSLNYCTGNMTVNVPGQSTITDVLWEADYYAECTSISCGLFCSHTVFMDDGGFVIQGPCGRAPSANSWYSCNTGCANCGTCSGSTVSDPYLADCQGPQCPNYSLNFEIHNIHCNVCGQPSVSYGNCNTSYHYIINNSWTITVEARTVEQNPISSSSGTTICNGNSTTLTANPNYGVPGYSYNWSTGGTSQSITVSPSSNTTYSVTVTDNCGNTSTESITINVTGPTANAGSDATICEGDSYSLNGSIGGTATSATWTTSGDGSFANPSNPTTTYTPGSNDISSGSVTLTLTASDGSCPDVSDQMTLTIDPAATVSAGSNATICEGDSYGLNGSFGGSASSITWSTSGDGSFSNTSDPNATYTPGSNDISNGSVTLTITTNDPAGPCPAVSDQMTLTIDPAATVSAGSNATICEGDSYGLNGSFGGGASSITWSTSGDGSFSNTSDPNATYTPGSNDISSGSVTLTITTNDPAGPCPAVSDQMTLTIDPAATVSAGSNATICEGDSYGLSGSFGGSASSITWSTSGDGSFSNTSDPNATYTPGSNDISNGSVTLTITTNDPAGPCPAVSDQMTLTIDPAATVSAGSNASICESDSYGLNGSYGGGASSITWSTSGDGSFSNTSDPNATYTPGSNDISNGSVTLTITTNDPAGPCPAVSDQMTLTIFPDPTASISPDPASMCAGGTLNMNGNPSGGSGTYTSHSWTNDTGPLSSTTVVDPDFSTNTPGTYNLTYTVTDDNGCTASDNITVTVNDTPSPSISPDPAVVCANGSLNMNGNPSGGSGTYTSHSWTNDTGPLSSTTVVDPTFSTTTPGTYDLNYTVTDDNGCSGSDNITVTVNDTPSIDTTNMTVTNATCGNSDGSITNISASGSGGLSYQWTDAGNNVVGSNLDLNNVPAGSYTLEVTDGNGCVSAMGPINVLDQGGPTIDASNITISEDTCSKGVGSITGINVSGGTPPLDYLWEDGSGNPVDSSTSTADVDSLSGGSYTLIVTDDNGCTATSGPHTLNDLIGPSIDSTNFAIAPDTCSNNVGEITGIVVNGGNSPLTYTWEDSTGTVVSTSNSNADLIGVGANQYWLTVSDAYGCVDSTGPYDLNNIPGPDLDTSNMTITQPTCGNNDGSITGIVVNNGTSPFEYVWDSAGTPIDSSTTSADINNLYQGDYTLTVTDANGCVATVGPLNVVEQGAPTIDDSNVQIADDTCSSMVGAISGITVSGGAAPVSFVWDSSGTTIDSSTTTVGVDSLWAGSYTLTVIDDNGCVATSGPYVVNDLPGPSLDSSNVVVADDTCSSTNGSVSGINVSGGSSPLSYEWYDGSGNVVGANSDLNGVGAGSYSVVVTDANGCKDSLGVFTVNDLPGPTIDTSGLAVQNSQCNASNGSISGIAVNGGSSPVTHIWLDQNGNVVDSSMTSADLDSVPAGSYTLVVSDANQCIDTLGPVAVLETGGPTADFSLDPVQGMVPLEVTFSDSSIGADFYEWDFGDGDSSSLMNPVHVYEETGDYEVVLSVEDSSGCTDTARYRFVMVDAESSFKVPNVFSPNGDGKNDRFRVIGEHLESLDAEIFNRWGELIYSWNTPEGGWDGRTSAGVKVPEGTYLYNIKATGVDGRTYSIQGSVTLVR